MFYRDFLFECNSTKIMLLKLSFAYFVVPVCAIYSTTYMKMQKYGVKPQKCHDYIHPENCSFEPFK